MLPWENWSSNGQKDEVVVEFLGGWGSQMSGGLGQRSNSTMEVFPMLKLKLIFPLWLVCEVHEASEECISHVRNVGFF